MQSDPASAHDELVQELIQAIHDGLGGNGWAYTNYGGDELRSKRKELEAAALAALAVARPVIREECARVAIKEARELEIANATDRDTWAVQVRSGGIITAKDIAAAIRAME